MRILAFLFAVIGLTLIMVWDNPSGWFYIGLIGVALFFELIVNYYKSKVHMLMKRGESLEKMNEELTEKIDGTLEKVNSFQSEGTRMINEITEQSRMFKDTILHLIEKSGKFPSDQTTEVTVFILDILNKAGKILPKIKEIKL